MWGSPSFDYWFERETGDSSDGCCQRGPRKSRRAFVADARKDPEWNDTPDIKLGMTFFLGYSLRWPDVEIIGTICILDGKDNPEAVRSKSLASESHPVVEGELCVIT